VLWERETNLFLFEWWVEEEPSKEGLPEKKSLEEESPNREWRNQRREKAIASLKKKLKYQRQQFVSSFKADSISSEIKITDGLTKYILATFNKTYTNNSLKK
jgi:hypothetical protein